MQLKVVSVLLGLVLLAFIGADAAVTNGSLPLKYYTVYYHALQGEFSVSPGKNTAGVAWAGYAGYDTYLQCGWSYLSIETNGLYPDEVQAAGAGYLEGQITKDMIWDYWQNLNALFTTNPPLPSGLVGFLAQQQAYITKQVNANPNDPYWQEIYLITAQLEGLKAGYNAVADPSKQLTSQDFAIINMDGDLEELMSKYGSNWNGLAAERKKMKQPAPGHCTSLVRWTADGSELYTMHTTWSTFVEMNRIFKSYNWNTLRQLSQPNAKVNPSKGVLFSSYPATLSSIDDFYMLSNRIVVTETTNGIYNNSLYNAITPTTVLSWMRVVAANRLATSAQSWTELFARQNSGTYNNQWIVVDYNLFTPGKPLPDSLLWIAEQIPGYVYRADVTNYLRVGFWESYNVPFNPYVYNVSGFAALAAQFGNAYTHSMCPRATIFRRQAGSVEMLDDAKKFIRYNNYKNDPLSLGDAGNQISARYDLNQGSDRSAFGGIDGKVTSYKLVQQGIAYGQSGPTHDQVPFFNWKTANFPGVVHQGQPDVWNYGWVAFNFTSAWAN